MGRNGYRGSATFKFEVERYKDLDGKMYTESEIEKLDGDLNIEGVIIKLTVSGSASFSPGYTYGLPENCYDSESESEINSVVDSNGIDWISHLTDNEIDQMEEVLCQEVENINSGARYDIDSCYDDYDDYDYPNEGD